jgi:hypothetical protein
VRRAVVFFAPRQRHAYNWTGDRDEELDDVSEWKLPLPIFSSGGSNCSAIGFSLFCQPLFDAAKQGNVTLLFSAHDTYGS